MTVECGRIGTPAGVAHAAEFIESALALTHFPEHPLPETDIDLLQTFAIVKVPADATLLLRRVGCETSACAATSTT